MKGGSRVQGGELYSNARPRRRAFIAYPDVLDGPTGSHDLMRFLRNTNAILECTTQISRSARLNSNFHYITHNIAKYRRNNGDNIKHEDCSVCH